MYNFLWLFIEDGRDYWKLIEIMELSVINIELTSFGVISREQFSVAGFTLA